MCLAREGISVLLLIGTIFAYGKIKHPLYIVFFSQLLPQQIFFPNVLNCSSPTTILFHFSFLTCNQTMVVCFCGKLALVKTSWTPLNPGRRFYACPTKDSVCGFIGWVDPPMCARSKTIIPGLLRNINTLEERCNGLVRSINMLQEQCNGLLSRNNMLEARCDALKDEGFKLKMYLCASWFMFVIVIFSIWSM